MTLTESARTALELRYEQAAAAFVHSLPMEHFMESVPQATQRQITVDRSRARQILAA